MSDLKQIVDDKYEMENLVHYHHSLTTDLILIKMKRAKQILRVFSLSNFQKDISTEWKGKETNRICDMVAI